MADIFDDIVLAEETFTQQGYKEGYKLGEKSGYQEGVRLGCKQGRQIGSELGFYRGFVCTCQQSLKSNNKLQGRKEKLITTLLEEIDAFDLTNPEDPNLQQHLQHIRAKFKQLMSLLNILPDYGGSETGGVSF